VSWLRAGRAAPRRPLPGPCRALPSRGPARGAAACPQGRAPSAALPPRPRRRRTSTSCAAASSTATPATSGQRTAPPLLLAPAASSPSPTPASGEQPRPARLQPACWALQSNPTSAAASPPRPARPLPTRLPPAAPAAARRFASAKTSSGYSSTLTILVRAARDPYFKYLAVTGGTEDLGLSQVGALAAGPARCAAAPRPARPAAAGPAVLGLATACWAAARRRHSRHRPRPLLGPPAPAQP
jgi:hypothetical protein